MADNVYTTNKLNAQSDKTAASDAMRDQVFADSSAFLAAAKSDFSKFGPDNSGVVSRQQLEHYADNGWDGEARQVARTIANHLDDIKTFRHDMPSYSVNDKSHDGLALTDLQLVDDAMHGNAKPYVDRRVAHDNSEFKWDVGLAAAWTVSGIANGIGQNYWLAGISAGMTGMHIVEAKEDWDDAKNADAKIRDKFQKEKDSVAGWTEFNHR